MRLTWSGARFNLYCNSNEYQKAREEGFHWDYRTKCCWTGRLDIARKYAAYADQQAKEQLDREKEQIALSRAVDANIEVPHPDGLDYLPFQKAGIAFALSRQDTLIADSMGLGKSIMVCGVINADATIKNVLIICPASLKINWSRELQRWVVRNLTGGLGNSKELPGTDIVIINYEIVSKLRAAIDKRKWDLLVMDESHFCKNPSAKRTMAVLGYETPSGKTIKLPIQARRRIALSGTPILNRPIDLWPLLRIFDPEGLGSSFFSFGRRYAGAWEAPWGWDFSRATNLEELNERLRNSCMIRRLKSEVMSELPPKRRQIIPIPPDSCQKLIDEEKQFYEKNKAILDEAVELAEKSQVEKDDTSYKEATEKLKSVKKVMFEQMASLRYKTAIAKIPFVIEYLEDALENEDKVVCFCHHREVVEKIVEHFGSKAVKLYGGMNEKEKQESIDRFQTDRSISLFVGSTQAAGIGITLTAASLVIFAELDWTPSLLTQAEDRLHRIGQKDIVNIVHLVFDQSLDANMAKMLVQKQQMIEAALDNKKEEVSV